MPKGIHHNHARGDKCGRWNRGKMLSPEGYVKMRVGRAHPLADPNGYAYEHRLVIAAAGIQIPDGYVIHHKNGDKTDNRLENLEVVARGVHNAHHNINRERDGKGRFTGKVRAGHTLDGMTWNELPGEDC